MFYNFLNEFTMTSKKEFRDFIFTSMIMGDYIAFRDYFNKFHNDVNGYDKLFRSPKF